MNVEELLAELIRFPTEAPPGNEEECARFIEDYISDLHISDCEVEIHRFQPKRANLIAHIGPSNSPGLMLAGHMDTVPAGDLRCWYSPPFEPRIQSDRLFGRGAADMKGGLAAMLKALELLKESKMRRQLVFVATAGEEIGYDGLKSMIQHGKLTGREASYCVIGEPTELKVARAHKGGTTFRIVFQGKSAHSSRPELGINAVENASLFVRELIDWRKKLATIRDPDLGSSILTVTIIRGGVKNNVVPESCELTIDCRRIPLHTPETITEGLLSIIQNLRQRDPSFHATVEMIFNNEPFLTAKDSPIVTLTEAITGSESIVVPYGTEAPAYQGLGISTVILGPGSVEQAHIANEFIELSEVRKAVSIYGELIRRVCL